MADPTDESAQGGELASVNDVAAFVAVTKPELPARRQVLDALEQCSPPCPVYLTQAKNWASRMGDRFEWQAERSAIVAGMQLKVGRDSWVMGGRRSVTPVPVAAREGRPGIFGEAATWRMLRGHWLGDPSLEKDTRQLCESALRQLAIPAKVAVEIFGYPTKDAGQARAAPVLALINPIATEALADGQTDYEIRAIRERIDSHRPLKKNGRKWINGEAAVKAEMLRQYEDRMSLPDAEAATSEEKIAGIWGLTINTVHAYLTDARKQRERMRSEAVTARA